MAAAAGALQSKSADEPFSLDYLMPLPTPVSRSTPRSATSTLTGSEFHTCSSRIEDDLKKEQVRSSALQDYLTENSGSTLIESMMFKGIVSFCVAVNAILMGFEVDFPEAESTWNITNHTLAAVFFIEMVLKIAALRIQYFYDKWNILDCSLALLALMDTWCMTILNRDGDLGLQRFTILRVLKLVRLARLARLFRAFNRLVIVMKSIVDAIESTLWVSSVLLCCIYVAAIVCVIYIGHDGKDLYPGYSDVMQEIDQQEVMENFNPYLSFGSMQKAMVTLFNMAILAEWADIIKPVMVKQPMLVVFFVSYCAFVCFGVMNVIIGMIVDSVIQNARALEKELEHGRKQEKVTILAELKQALFEVDEDEDYTMDIDEVNRFINGDNPALTHLLSKLSLPYGCSAEEFFSMIDNDGDGVLIHDEFLTNLYRLINCGPFQQTCLLQMGINDVKKIVKTCSKETNARLDEIARHIGLRCVDNSDALDIGMSNTFSEQRPQEDQPSLHRPPETPKASIDKVGPFYESEPERTCGDVAATLNAVCEEVSVILQHKVRSELALRLKYFFTDDDCQACGRGIWEPFGDAGGKVQDDKVFTQNKVWSHTRDQWILSETTVGPVSPASVAKASGRDPVTTQDMQRGNKHAAGSSAAASSSAGNKPPAEKKHAVTLPGVAQRDWSHPMAVPRAENSDPGDADWNWSQHTANMAKTANTAEFVA